MPGTGATSTIVPIKKAESTEYVSIANRCWFPLFRGPYSTSVSLESEREEGKDQNGMTWSVSRVVTPRASSSVLLRICLVICDKPRLRGLGLLQFSRAIWTDNSRALSTEVREPERSLSLAAVRKNHHCLICNANCIRSAMPESDSLRKNSIQFYLMKHETKLEEKKTASFR